MIRYAKIDISWSKSAISCENHQKQLNRGVFGIAWLAEFLRFFVVKSH